MYNVLGLQSGRRLFMPKTVVRGNESIEDALRRFKRDVSRSGVLQDARKREFYVKPSVNKKIKRMAARQKKYQKNNTDYSVFFFTQKHKFKIGDYYAKEYINKNKHSKRNNRL